ESVVELHRPLSPSGLPWRLPHRGLDVLDCLCPAHQGRRAVMDDDLRAPGPAVVLRGHGKTVCPSVQDGDEISCTDQGKTAIRGKDVARFADRPCDSVVSSGMRSALCAATISW